jgi:capsular polysaccharide biosynthesis protein
MLIEKEICAGHSIDYPFPLLYERKDRHLFFDENFSFQIPPVHLHQLTDVFFNSDTVKKGWRVLDPFLRHNQVSIVNQVKRSLKLQTQKVKKRENVILGFQVWGNNYFHWMTETVPAIIAMHQHDENALVMLPKFMLDVVFVKEVLDMMAWKYDTISHNESVKASSFYAITLPHVGRFNHHLLNQAVEQLRIKTGVDSNIVPYRRIYITRAKARRRKIINENALVRMLTEQGFEIHTLEDYSLDQQFHLFNESKFVLSNHGAGLTNIMFMHPNTKVLELKSENNNYWCYFSLANVFGLKYAYMLCKGNSINHRDADIDVDLNELSAMIEKIIF